jgi:xyloglucan-specific exo-beta-1,4-glucanase
MKLNKCINPHYFKTAFVILIVSMLNFVCYSQSETYTWQNVAMGGGGFVTGIIPSKTEQNLVYARTDVGGAYRWDAANSKWIPLLDWVSEDELGFLGVESIAIDPHASAKVYMLVGTSYFNNGKTAILKSDDYGNTFSVVNVTSQFKAHGNGMGRQSGEKLQVDPNKGSVLYCGTRADGLFKSTDSGSSWSKVTALATSTTPNGNGISFVVLDPSTGTTGNETQTIITGFSATGTNMYRSDNGGATFSAISGAPTSLMPHRAVLATDRNLYVTYANAAGPWDISGTGQIWKYNLSSGAWSNVTPAGFTGAYGGISVDPNNANRLVASSLNTYQLQDNSYGDRIFLSTDGGTNWTDVVARGFDLDPNGVTWVDGHAIHWAGSIEFDPFDTKKAWVVSGNGVFHTSDIDATVNVWKFQVAGMEETVPLDIASVPNGPLVSVIGDYDGFRHTNVEAYAPIHTPRMGSTHSIAVAALDPNVMLRIGEDKIYYSLDMGMTWTQCTRTGTKGSVAVSADGKIFMYSPETSGATYRSTNRGASWTQVTGLSINWAKPVGDPVNPNKFYAYNNNAGSVYVSTNGGVSFSAAGSVGTGASKVIRVAPGREGDVWIPLYSNGLTRSTNSGQNFSKIAAVTYCGAVGFGKEADGATYPAIYIWGTVNGVLGIHRSTDEGATWLRVNDDAHEYGGPANGQFVTGDMNVFGRVYMSTAGRGIVYGETDQTCLPTNVIPRIKKDAGALQQTSLIAFENNMTVMFSPQPESGGSWAWTGPNGFSSADREITLPNITADKAGIYRVRYTNADGCKSALQTFTVALPTIQAKSINIKSQSNKFTIDEKDGTLQLIAEINPVDAVQSIDWNVVSNPEVATVSSTGLVTALKDGKVTVRGTATDGSNVYGQVQITVTNQTITAIEESGRGYFNIYPNPVSSSLNIDNTFTVKRVQLRSVTGSVIHSISNDKSNQLTIPLDNIPAGLYLVEILDVSNITYSKRILKY